MSSKQHSKVGASSCERWVNCPASVQLHQQVGDGPTSFYAAEGTVAHEVAEYALRYYLTVKKNGELQGWLGKIQKQDGYDVPITQEMIDGAMLYADTIAEDMYYDGLTNSIDGYDCPKQQFLMIEKEINLTEHGLPDCFGTVDAAYTDGIKIVVYDYKYGKGIDVDVQNNYQMSFYALGVAHVKHPEKDVVLKVVQPRSPLNRLVKEWATDYEYLKSFAKKLNNAISKVDDIDPPYQTSDKWCRWCPGKLVCPEIRNKVQEVAKIDFADLLPVEKQSELLDVTRMSNVELSALLKNEKLIKGFLESGKEEAYRRLEAGEKIEGFELAQKLGNRVWTKDAEDVLFEQYGAAIYEQKSKMLTPAAIKKEFGVDVDELTVRPSSLSITATAKKHGKTVQAFNDLV